MWAVWNNYNNLRLCTHFYIAVTLCRDQCAYMKCLYNESIVSSMVLALSIIDTANHIFTHYAFLKLKVRLWYHFLENVDRQKLIQFAVPEY